jgi:hypothetical protein
MPERVDAKPDGARSTGVEAPCGQDGANAASETAGPVCKRSARRCIPVTCRSCCWPAPRFAYCHTVVTFLRRLPIVATYLSIVGGDPASCLHLPSRPVAGQRNSASNTGQRARPRASLVWGKSSKSSRCTSRVTRRSARRRCCSALRAFLTRFSPLRSPLPPLRICPDLGRFALFRTAGLILYPSSTPPDCAGPRVAAGAAGLALRQVALGNIEDTAAGEYRQAYQHIGDWRA